MKKIRFIREAELSIRDDDEEEDLKANRCSTFVVEKKERKKNRCHSKYSI